MILFTADAQSTATEHIPQTASLEAVHRRPLPSMDLPCKEPCCIFIQLKTWFSADQNPRIMFLDLTTIFQYSAVLQYATLESAGLAPRV